MAQRLKLKALSPEDIQVMSSVLQDAAVKVADLAYLPKQHRFAAVLNRYRWEGVDDRRHRRHGERVRAGLHFEGVLRAQFQNVPMDRADHVMELLAVEAEPGEDGAAVLNLVFSGFAAIRLEVECLDGVLEDLSDPWAALERPHHALD